MLLLFQLPSEHRESREKDMDVGIQFDYFALKCNIRGQKSPAACLHVGFFGGAQETPNSMVDVLAPF
ncbi:hypothetical protein EYC80_005160 [Monilinia laxa]|uniref:Uncharacterized protein n=1 Tax=Monilinia laxa TaxID=61186 RepID=A0A5N6KJA0_MONLA|nr:hypothetical protein EYC80_005160 [Monilinia laxa]